MKRSCICILILLLALQISPAFAKREVNSADYATAGEFLADIETGTKVTFDAYLFSTQPYVDEDTFSLSYVLLPQIGVQYSPSMCIYAREEDLGDIHATVLGETRETHYVHVTGIAEGPAKYDCVYIYIMDGQGSMEIIEPEYMTYCLDDITDIEEFKKKAINNLDRLEIRDGIVVKTDDTNVKLNHYQVWVSCGSQTLYFQTREKQFFVADHVTGSGIFSYFTKDGNIFLGEPALSLVQ